MIPIFYVVYHHSKTVGMFLQSLVEPYYRSASLRFCFPSATHAGEIWGRTFERGHYEEGL
jgi:hypothetical protein